MRKTDQKGNVMKILTYLKLIKCSLKVTSDFVYLSENINQMKLNQLIEAEEKNDAKGLQDVIKKCKLCFLIY